MAEEAERKPDDERVVLLSELQHRVRNMLWLTRTIARRSAESSESLEDYVAHLDGRLGAMARVQNRVIRDPRAGLDLASLISEELATVQADDPARARLAGPTVLLHPRAAETLTLALHELTTNALKYGALSAPVGRIAVTWRSEVRAGAPILVLDWTETGVRLDPNEDRRDGFGRVVLEELLTYQLEAEVQLDFSPEGLICRIVLPLTERIVLATGGVGSG
jgi:two-component sensor histidine kinase